MNAKIRIVLMALLFWPPISLLAATESRTAVCRMEWQKVSGRVEAMDLENRKLELRDKNGNLVHISINNDVQIFRDWRLVTLDDLKERDQVTLRTGTTRL